MIKWVLVLVVAVVVLSAAGPWLTKIGLGRLPGDFVVRWKGRPLYLPITSTVLVSVAMTLLLRIL